MKKHTWIDCWNSLAFDNSRGNKETTLVSYRKVLFNLILPDFELLKKQGYKNFTYVEDFKFQEYKIWYRCMKNKKKVYGNTTEKYSVNTLRRYYCVLSRIVDEAMKNGWVKLNVVKISDNFVTDKEQLKVRKIRYQTLDEFNLFMTVVDEEFWRVLLSILFWHGFRIGELLALQVKDIDRENLKIHIHKTVAYHVDHQKYKLTSTKNYRDQLIDININCCDLFINYFDEFVKNKNVDENSFIFSYKIKDPLWQCTVRQHLKKYYNRLEKKLNHKVNRLTSQEFGRHSIATYMKENGASVEQVAYYLRDSEWTIEHVYFHNYEKKLRKEISNFFDDHKV